MTKKGTSEEVNQKFIPIDIKSIDTKNRITIGEKVIKRISGQNKVSQFQVFIGQDGDILLRPLTTIPSREAWIYEKSGLIGQIRQGLQEVKEGKLEKIEKPEEL